MKNFFKQFIDGFLTVLAIIFIIAFAVFVMWWDHVRFVITL